MQNYKVNFHLVPSLSFSFSAYGDSDCLVLCLAAMLTDASSMCYNCRSESAAKEVYLGLEHKLLCKLDQPFQAIATYLTTDLFYTFYVITASVSGAFVIEEEGAKKARTRFIVKVKL